MVMLASIAGVPVVGERMKAWPVAWPPASSIPPMNGVSNNLNILFGDKEYESLSTGERLKADIVVQLSLRDMLCETLGFSCNIIVLDELFDGLDEIGCEQVINLLFNNLSDISSTFIITHRRDLPITSDNIITVLKNKDGVSILK